MIKNLFFVLVGVILLLRGSLLQSQWVHIPAPTSGAVHCFAVLESDIFLGTDSGAFISNNGGDSWMVASNGLYDKRVYCLAFSGSDLFAGTDSGGVFFTSHLGASWTYWGAGLSNSLIRCLAVGPPPNLDSRSIIYAGSWGGGIYRMTDWGGVWAPIDTGLDGVYIKSMVVKDSTLYAVSEVNGVFLSENKGDTWSTINSGLNLDSGSAAPVTVEILGVCDSDLYAGVAYNDTTLGGSVYRYDYGSMSWTGPILSAGFIRGFASSDSNIIVASTQGIYLSRDTGVHWLNVTGNLPTLHVNTVAICNSVVFASNETGIWRRPLADMITSIKTNTNAAPAEFHLKQNYPNPFNPRTTVEFSVPMPGLVTLKVYDIRGAEVATLMNETISAGNYSTEWDGSPFSSGIYFYRLQAGKNIEVRKLVLLK